MAKTKMISFSWKFFAITFICILIAALWRFYELCRQRRHSSFATYKYCAVSKYETLVYMPTYKHREFVFHAHNTMNKLLIYLWLCVWICVCMYIRPPSPSPRQQLIIYMTFIGNCQHLFARLCMCPFVFVYMCVCAKNLFIGRPSAFTTLLYTFQLCWWGY